MEALVTSIGRRYQERTDTLIKDPFLNDLTKLLHSKCLRRLADKTQVITDPDKPHARTRLIHTHEVVATSIAIAEKLGLNINLCMAIATGHDIGHAPYGHLGENILSKIGGKPFRHEVNGVVIAQHIERKGKGLNLTHETLEGILNHSKRGGELTTNESIPNEYSVVMLADKIAYTLSDLNDAIRYGFLKDIPESASNLGRNQRERTKKVVNALAKESKEIGKVQFSEGRVFENFLALRTFMYNLVYYKMIYNQEHSLQADILYHLHNFFTSDERFKSVDPILLISLLTDKEANYFGSQLLLKCNIPSAEQIKHFGIFEILPYLRNKEIDYTNPDLDW